MKFNKYLICALFLVLICCIGVASAADASDDSVAANDTIDEEVTEAVDVSDEIDEEPLGVSEEPALSDGETGSDEEYVIYVGHNNKTEYGEGTEDNPFSSLKIACDNVNGQEKVTVKIFNGTYELGDGCTETTGAYLKFNTNNLNIVGYNGTVTIEPFFKSGNPRNKNFAESFGLTANDGNFSMANIIFDSSKRTLSFETRSDRQCWFQPFYGSANNVLYYNCSFVGLKNNNGLSSGDYNCQFINCYFDINSNKQMIFPYPKGQLQDFKSLYFDYCYFNMPLNGKLATTLVLPLDVTINNSWFGRNSISNSFVAEACYESDGFTRTYDWMPVINRYAVFSVFEYYLGNNQYNITGKLTWNGTDDQDGMENFPQLDVNLISDNGDIVATVPMVNNAFSTIYTGTTSSHYIKATLGYQPIELEFNTVNINVTAPAIKYGEDQNITINFSQPINSTVVITVNNRPYSVKVNESNVVTYTIKDVNLTKGEYAVNVTLNDAVNHIYGSNSTILSVSKVSTYTFNPVVPSEAKVGDTVNINVELPDDVTGNVTVYVNNNPITQQASKNTVIPITDLVEGNNEIIVFYEGNDKYENKTSAKQYITADKVSDYSFDVILPNNVKVGDNPSITIKLPNDANGNAIVYVGSQAGKSVPVTSDSTNVPISGLIAGNNTIKVVFSDNRYEEKTITKNLTVEKVSAYEFKVTLPTNVKVGDTANVVINLPDDASGNVTVYLGEVPFKDTVNGNTISVPISGFVEGNNNISVVYEGNGKYVGKTFNGNISVDKKPVEITNNTIVVDTPKDTTAPTVSINLPQGATGNLTVIVNGKPYIKELVNGSAAITITDLPAGTYNATVIYSGDKVYDSINTTTTITVSESKKQNTNTNTNTNTKKNTKVATKIIAKNKKFKAKTKVKKYTITLKTKAGKAVKKVQVTLKIKGKTYKAKTNAKGKATFKIKKLTKKGKHKAVIKFAGNKNYKACSKKVKITIKK